MKCKLPTNLNINQLVQEFAAAGIIVKGAEYENGKLISDNRFFVNEDGLLTFELEAGDEKTAASIVNNHNGVLNTNEPTIEEKLALVGLNLEDLKKALGILI